MSRTIKVILAVIFVLLMTFGAISIFQAPNRDELSAF